MKYISYRIHLRFLINGKYKERKRRRPVDQRWVFYDNNYMTTNSQKAISEVIYFWNESFKGFYWTHLVDKNLQDNSNLESKEMYAYTS